MSTLKSRGDGESPVSFAETLVSDVPDSAFRSPILGVFIVFFKIDKRLGRHMWLYISEVVLFLI